MQEWKRTRFLTLTRVRIAIMDSKIGFVGVVLSVSLKAVKVSMSVLRISVIAERCSTVKGMSSTLRGSRVAMVRGDDEVRVGVRQQAVE